MFVEKTMDELFEDVMVKSYYHIDLNVIRVRRKEDSTVYVAGGKPVFCNCIPYQDFDRRVHGVGYFLVLYGSDGVIYNVHIFLLFSFLLVCLQDFECILNRLATGGGKGGG